MRENYCSPFVNHLCGGNDPHDCWQEDGFWPERVTADLNDLLVWGCEIGLTYFNNGGMIAYLEYISGRTMPEVREGFRILSCGKCVEVCDQILNQFPNPYPRVDQERLLIVQSKKHLLERLGDTLWSAMDDEQFDDRTFEYYKDYCVSRGIPPWGHGNAG